MLQIKKNEVREFRNYEFYPAVLRETTSTWYIEYYVQNPTTGGMERKRIKVNKIKKRYTKLGEARKHISEMILALNEKLRNGWNPFFEGEDARLYTKLSDVVEIYLKEKGKELRPDSMRCYSSSCSMLMAWVARKNSDLFFSLFNHSYAVRFMDYIYNERNVSARSYNNYLKLLRVLFDWGVGKGYAKENPFSTIKTKRKEKKERILIDQSSRQLIAKHLDGKPFLLVCMLVYHSLIRPKEIRNLKIGDIDLNQHCIKVSGEIAKNHNTRFAAISPQIEKLIDDLKIMKCNKNWYIFSDRETMAPGTVKLYDAKFTKEFAKLRKEIRLDPKMQLYSLRDTGIFEMLKNGVDDLSVMQHADHSSLDITTIYANHYDPKLNERIREKAPDF